MQTNIFVEGSLFCAKVETCRHFIILAFPGQMWVAMALTVILIARCHEYSYVSKIYNFLYILNVSGCLLSEKCNLGEFLVVNWSLCCPKYPYISNIDCLYRFCLLSERINIPLLIS